MLDDFWKVKKKIEKKIILDVWDKIGFFYWWLIWEKFISIKIFGFKML